MVIQFPCFELDTPFPKIAFSKNLGKVRSSNVILPWHFAPLNEGFPIQCYLSHAFYSSKEFREALRSPSQINSSKGITKFPAVQFCSSSITEARWVEVLALTCIQSPQSSISLAGFVLSLLRLRHVVGGNTVSWWFQRCDILLQEFQCKYLHIQRSKSQVFSIYISKCWQSLM